MTLEQQGPYFTINQVAIHLSENGEVFVTDERLIEYILLQDCAGAKPKFELLSCNKKVRCHFYGGNDAKNCSDLP